MRNHRPGHGDPLALLEVVETYLRLNPRDEEVREAQAVGAALLKGVGEQARGDKAGKNARDGYMAERLEIAAYQLLERLAEKAATPRRRRWHVGIGPTRRRWQGG